MVKKRCLALILLLFLSPVLFVENNSSGEITDGVLFSEVQPFGSHEGVSLFNYGPENVNLNGWSITDGEGTLTFAEDICIEPFTRLTIVKTAAADDWFSGRDRVITFDDERIQKKGSFILADAGDDIYLYCGSVLIDAVCYGNKKAEEGWVGEPVSLPSGRYLLRIGSVDTDSLTDWNSTKPGLTNNVFDPELYFDAVVTPFSFPESRGSPIFKEIGQAEREVLISIYLLTSVQLVALLCDLSERGVRVCVLLEGNVLGYDISTELTLMRSLADAGGEVYLINDPAGSYKRFSYFHNKYAVIDSEKVIVTSENWTSSNLGPGCSNRGWGIVAESNGFAEYVRNVFLSDLNQAYGDVRPLLDLYPALKPYQGALSFSGAEDHQETAAFDARIMPVLSPDNSASALKYFIENSDVRVFSQQLDLGSSYKTVAGTSPLRWMLSAAERGVDTRLILDSSANGGRNDEYVNTLNNTTAIKAISVNGKASFSLIHNKGVIMDDLVWVGSVNWTEGSFVNNREFAMVIDSPEVTAFFAELFIEDWGVNEHTIAETGLEITFDVLSFNGEPIYAFYVSGPEHYAYVWDVLGEGILRRSDINMIVCTGLPEGTYTISVAMDGTPYSASCEYTVTDGGGYSFGGDSLWAAAAAGLMAAGGAGVIMRRRNNNR